MKKDSQSKAFNARSSNQAPEQLRRKTFIVEKFINFLIVIRMYLTSVPLWLYVLLLGCLYLVKLRREGNVPTSALLIIAMICSFVGEYLKIDVLYLMAPIIAGVSHFISKKIYWFPRVIEPIGFRETVLPETDLYVAEMYQIEHNQKARKKVIPWNYRLEKKKILEYQENRSKIMESISWFFVSAIEKVRIIFAEGDEKKTRKGIVYSHGRTGTPFTSSQLMMRVLQENQDYSLVSVQHTEQRKTGEVELEKIKKFRYKEVQKRADELHESFKYLQGEKDQIVMMGHSYGCATVVQSYLNLSEEEKKKVTHLVLLDPWFFPLTDKSLKAKINCKVLVLANEFFLYNEHVYELNAEFLKSHPSAINLTWKDGDHLHQTDFGFIMGNIRNVVQRPDLSLEMFNKNIQAITMFLNEKGLNQQKMSETFSAELVAENWKPQKWNDYLHL